MKVLIYSPAFLPLLGGLERITETLARQLASRGHEITVATTTPAGDRSGEDGFPFRVVRRPSPSELLRWTRWCDVFLQQNVALRGLWPLLLVRRPWVASHNSWYSRPDGRRAWQDRLKRLLLRRAAGSVSISQAMADDLDTPSTVVRNAYRDDLFRVLPGVERTRDLLFVGRLVSDKGVDLLIEALARLAARGVRPGLTIVGTGPEERPLADQAARLGVGDQVRMLGPLSGEDLVRQMNEHRLLVVPSRYQEPFGIVALEGIACGCLVVGSAGGGLKEAIGPCGLTFPNGDAAALADLLGRLLADPEAGRDLLRHAPEHLARHTPAALAQGYESVLEQAVLRRRRRHLT